MSITEKETGNPSKRKRDRGEEGQRRREIEKKKKRGNNEQRECKGYSRIYYIDI